MPQTQGWRRETRERGKEREWERKREGKKERAKERERERKREGKKERGKERGKDEADLNGRLGEVGTVALVDTLLLQLLHLCVVLALHLPPRESV